MPSSNDKRIYKNDIFYEEMPWAGCLFRTFSAKYILIRLDNDQKSSNFLEISKYGIIIYNDEPRMRGQFYGKKR